MNEGPVETSTYDPTYLRESIVCYIDILGFSAEVCRANDDLALGNIGEFLYLLKGKLSKEISDVLDEIKIFTISDSIIITALMPVDGNDLGQHKIGVLSQVFIAARVVQFCCLEYRGFRLSRGYLCIGKCYHKDDIIFGEAYIRAYEGERENPNPTIIVSDEVVDHYGSIDNFFAGNITRINNGAWFIDYLHDFWKLKGSDENGGIGQLNVFIKTSMERVESFSKKPGISEKYQWFIQYAQGHLDDLQNSTQAVE